ncbi:MAG: hypothetical protein GXX79_14755 [Actinomycetales bacterium]|nr:hypothetical protein [Actinomycetales bacterium]
MTSISAVTIRGLGMRWVAQCDRRLAATLPIRAAHSAHADWRELVGPRFWSALPLHVGSVLVGVAGTVLSTSTESMLVAVAALAAMTTLFTLAVIEVAGIVRRPTLAEDSLSLDVDHVLRVEDARLSIAPGLAVVLAVQVTSSSGFLDWLQIGMMALFVVMIVDTIVTAATSPSAARPVETRS